MTNEVKPAPTFDQIVDAAFNQAGIIEPFREGDIITPEKWKSVLKLIAEELKYLPKKSRLED